MSTDAEKSERVHLQFLVLEVVDCVQAVSRRIAMISWVPGIGVVDVLWE